MTATKTRPLTKAQRARLDKIEAAPYAPEATVPGECPGCGSTARMVRKDTPATPNGDCRNGWHRADSHTPDPADEAVSEADAAAEPVSGPDGTDGPPAPVAAPERPVGALALHDGQSDWTPAQLDVLRTLIQQDAVPTPPVLKMFLNNCQRTGLDPFAKQIYLVGRRNKRGEIAWATQTGIDGFRVVSQRTGEYRGMTPTQWCGPDGEWRDVWLEEGHPAAARVGIYRHGFVEPLYAVATWKSYYPGDRQGTMWNKMPDVMLAKVAEALARRQAFPQDLSGLYTSEEMEQADVDLLPAGQQTVESTVVEEPATPADPADVDKALRHVMALAVLKDTTALSAYWRELKGTPVHRAVVDFNGGSGTIADLIVWCGTNKDAAAEAASDWIDEHPVPNPETGETPMPGAEPLEGVIVEEDPPQWDGSESTDPAVVEHVGGA